MRMFRELPDSDHSSNSKVIQLYFLKVSQFSIQRTIDILLRCDSTREIAVISGDEFYIGYLALVRPFEKLLIIH